MMEVLSKRIVLALGIVAVITIGVNLTLFLLLLPYSSAQRSSTFYLESPELGLSEKRTPYADISGGTLDQKSTTISVTGVGVARAKPDRALISLGVITQADSAEEAISENSLKMNSVVQALKNMGLTGDQMETSIYSLTPVWDYSDRNSPRITGYTCSNTIRVTITDLNNMGRIIDDAVSAGANHVSSIQFTVSEEALRQLGLEALGNAVKDADSKAKAIASAAGVTLTNLFSISVLSYSPNVAGYSFEPAVPSPTSMGIVLTPILPPGEVSVTVSISAVYEFR
jgi:uncharacterized protein YggE